MKYQATTLDRLSLYSRSLSPAIARPLDVITGIEQTEHDLRIERQNVQKNIAQN